MVVTCSIIKEHFVNRYMSYFKNYLKEAAIKRGIVPGQKDSFKGFMLPWLFGKYDIGSSKSIVDIGAGSGESMIILHNNGFRNISVVDREDYFFDHFKKEFSFKCYKKDMDSDQLPFEDNSVDAIINSFFIAHLKEPDNFLSECHRVLKPGGILFTITPDWQKQYKTFWRDPTHFHPYDKVGLCRVLQMYGFKVEVFSWGCAFGMGRIKAYRWMPRLGLLGNNILAVGRKE